MPRSESLGCWEFLSYICSGVHFNFNKSPFLVGATLDGTRVHSREYLVLSKKPHTYNRPTAGTLNSMAWHQKAVLAQTQS